MELVDIAFTAYYGRKHQDAKRLEALGSSHESGFLGKKIREVPWIKTNVLTSKEGGHWKKIERLKAGGGEEKEASNDGVRCRL